MSFSPYFCLNFHHAQCIGLQKIVGLVLRLKLQALQAVLHLVVDAVHSQALKLQDDVDAQASPEALQAVLHLVVDAVHAQALKLQDDVDAQASPEAVL